MKTITIERADTRHVWKRSLDSIKFMENGLWGLKDKAGIILEPKYDQIELCKEFIYVHSGNRYSLYYPIGKIDEGDDDPEDNRFYKDGKIGLKYPDGKLRFPAIFDCVKEWKGYDVVYVRRGDDFHYYDSEGNEILTDYSIIENEKSKYEPFFVDEKQSTGIVINRRFVDKRINNNCVKKGKRWVELTRIPYKDVKKTFGNCELVPVPDDSFNEFESPSTYIYSCFSASSRSNNPVEDCITQLSMLGAYGATWSFITKICINPESTISMDTIKEFWLIFSKDSDSCKTKEIQTNFGVEDWLRIGVGYDNSLAKNEIQVKQIHYYNDRSPAPIEIEWVTAVQHMKAKELEKIKKQLDNYIERLQNNFGEKTSNNVHSEILEGCRIPYNIETELSTKEELLKYDYLKKIGFLCHDTLWHVCATMMAESLNEGMDHIMSKQQLSFCKSKIEWLLNNGTCKNYVYKKRMPLDMISILKQQYDEKNWSIEILTEIETLMKSSGCKYAQECNQNEIFWRQYKPGLYDELPFMVNIFRSKVSNFNL